MRRRRRVHALGTGIGQAIAERGRQPACACDRIAVRGRLIGARGLLSSVTRVVSVDLDADSPHVLISAGTGGGKSTILRTICCQFIHNGALAFVLDFKRISHTGARGVPGVSYCRDIAEIHDALVHLA